MGDSVSEGTILEWQVKEGDEVSEDQVLVEISTDKVDAEVPSPSAGTVVKIHAADGDTVKVGEVLAEISPNGGAPVAEAPPAEESGGQSVDIVMPAMGESVTEGTILEWAKQAGEEVAEDETIVEISTDKVDAEVPAPASGTIEEILAQAGDTVHVGQVLARMTTGNGARPAPAKAPEPTSAPRPQGSAPPPPIPDTVKVTPVAARVAAAEGVDLSRVQGSGPAGRISKADVLAAGNGAAAPAEAQLIKGASAMLARYMDESREVPTATSFRTLTVTTLDGRRKQLKEAGHKVSFTHLIAYAIARAATEQMPVMAHTFEEIGGKPHVLDAGAVNLGIAVDVERKDGGRTLMVPVIRDAGRLSFPAFLDAFGDLIARARDNKLTADDLQGANISLTNPGGIGTIASVPRLMKGQGTIVATGAIGYPPGLGQVGAQIGAEKVMTMTSTYDHRIIQGAESGQFLQVIEQYLQGEHGFYEQVFSDLGVHVAAVPDAPAPAAAPPAPVEAPTAEHAVVPEAPPSEQLLQAVQAATSLIKAHRTHGHLAARLDPLGSEPEGDPALDPEPLGLTPEIMAKIPAKILRTYVPGATLADALPHLRETYCSTIAYEIEHISSHRQRMWLREKIESGAFRAPLAAEEKVKLLRRLTQVDSLERFMHKAYLGQKQFSIEGLDMTVPMLDEMIQLSAAQGAREVVLGMAHRGRLNVLAHNLGRAYETVFREFEGASSIEAVTTIPQGGTGDVKYHHGAQGTYRLDDGSSIIVRLESNPSHLEYVSPVVEGATRAVQTSRQGPHAHLDTNAAIPIILHGDAALPGQGVVSETLNLQALDGYTVGGTLHIIQNNQVGFTTDPDDSRSTRWASDIAKGFDVPIIHVNADDVEACISAVRLAFAFRQEFGHDVMIDLIGYRRFGHNETDEPAYTQPDMAAIIKRKTPVRDVFAEQLVDQGVMTKDETDALAQEIWDTLSRRHKELKDELAGEGAEQPTGGYELDRSPSPEVRTAVDADALRRLNEELLAVPDGFTVHPKLIKQLERRRETVGPDGGIDWAHAEALAFASLLSEGTPIRLTGQDSERGTFSQRHLVLHDANTGQRISPIQSLPEAKAPMELHNSPLSEIACLGFEYGYSMEAPETLVLWEAQFGDFV
ncbi:MAG TPA: multifunctional oxoglutarate decarboxylase/oxoglutarate dehydrogenase thiamine pyrophosphate-binding subunit/dihydrolipoyllysine-residue succinyltransferase subunit, partial [Solirubrobacteraceae bacterium]|nr:multifunctional oxoglutarate decarboxylase/oxoglutarate dehydrogenase thiamine pyrophosphate-binding subunit/dihydrolipoyllysine-residue succinyltransferase subunit [Solirubrobacteraceae bacterium]